MLHNLEAVYSVLSVEPGDRAISYLPSAHIADRFFSHYTPLRFGVEVTCVDDPRMLPAALAEVHPTSLGAVPRIWEKLKAVLEARIANEPEPARKRVLEEALAIGLLKARAEQAQFRGDGSGPDPALLDAYADARERVLGPICAQIGLDQARWAISGAAPIAPETLEFFVALGIPICEMWAMSETLGTLTPPGRVKLGTVGRALPGVELALSAGELLVRGKGLMRGYHNEPEKTADVVDERAGCIPATSRRSTTRDT